jgi:hypothetical protein
VLAAAISNLLVAVVCAVVLVAERRRQRAEQAARPVELEEKLLGGDDWASMRVQH